MKLAKEFDKFLEKTVDLNQSRIDILKNRVDSIENFIKNNEVFKKAFIKLVPQGSWAHTTIIKPSAKKNSFDADVLLYLKEFKGWPPKDYIENLYIEFKKSGLYSDIVYRRTRCLVVDYKGEFHIDIIPAFVRSGAILFFDEDTTYITNRNQNKLEETNPEGYLEWFKEKNEFSQDMLVKVIKIAKYLRDIKQTFSVKSILLTTLLAQQINDSILFHDDVEEMYPDVPTALLNLFNNLNDFLQSNPAMPHIKNPSLETEDFIRHWDQEKYTNFREKIKFYADKINCAYYTEIYSQSILQWREILGESFASGVNVNECEKFDSIKHCQQPPWKMNLSEKVKIEAYIYDANKTKELAGIKSNGRILHKNLNLKFIANTSSDSNFAVHWQVVNTGKEARENNGLRGDFFCDNSRIWWEATAYKGTHWIECFLIKEKICYARSGKFFIRIC